MVQEKEIGNIEEKKLHYKLSLPELSFLSHTLSTRLQQLVEPADEALVLEPFPKESPLFQSSYFKNQQITKEEKLLLILALAPHLSPNFFDEAIHSILQSSGDYPQIGFTKGKSFRGFLPTGETAVFLLAGDDLQKRFEVEQLFSSNHWFFQKRILWLESVPEGEPIMSGRIILNSELVEYFKTGKVSRPAMSIDFPAQYISTELEWEDLILPDSTMSHIQELHRWVKHSDTLMNDWGMARKLKPGFRALVSWPSRNR